jgi:hypothetical protein
MAKEDKAPKLKGVKLVTPIGRLSFPHLFEPQAFKGDEGDDKGKKKYSCTLLWPKKKEKELLKPVRVAIKNAAKERWGDEIPEDLEETLFDGDDNEDLEGYKGMRGLRMATLNQPGVIDEDKNEILESSKIYGGCYARASVVFKAWEMGKPGKKGYRAGVTCYLQNVQFAGKGERFGGGSNAEDDFDVIENEDSDSDSGDDDDDFGDMGF